MLSNFPLIYSMFLLIILSVSTGLADGLPARRITILANGRTVDNISMEIQKKTGVKVLVSKKLKEIHVDGIYRSVEPEEFFFRALRKKNIILEWNKDILYVRGFGSKAGHRFYEYVQGRTKDLNSVRHQDNKLNKGIDPVSGLPIKELKQRYEMAIKAGKAMYEEQGIDPVSGLPINELKQRYEMAIKAGKAMYEEQGIDPVSGLPINELKQRYEMAIKAGKAMYEEQGVDPISGLPLR